MTDTKTRKLEDVTWFDAEKKCGLVIDPVAGRIDAEGLHAAGARIVMVVRGEDGLAEAVMPGMLGAAACLEVAGLLMAMAAIIDPAGVRRTLEEIHASNHADRLLQQPLPPGARLQ